MSTMSTTATRDPRATAPASVSFPPIEIGSFVSLPPDDSEFIGSASGVFFANTVFRAFASKTSQATNPADPGPPGHVGAATDDTGSRDPGSAHTYVVDPEVHEGQASRPEVSPESPTPVSGARSYGVDVVGLGLAPPPATAKKLLMVYFTHWHPFFPFLHGPTFFRHVNSFYEERGPAKSTAAADHGALCRAVTFQCIFNIAASASNQPLDAACRIHSASALTSLLGFIFSNHDIASIQALLAAELYLTAIMSLRAASTVHGALTRTMYNSGFHRCPSRYVQLSSDKSDIRKRIFWSAYILDRYISQAMGHPCSIQDMDVDVCIPGMAESHNPVQHRHAEQPAEPQSTLNEQAVDHLPQRRPDISQGGSGGTIETPSNSPGYVRGVSQAGLSPHNQSHQEMSRGKEANELILGHFVTYSHLLGEVISLLHRSLHSRTTNHDNIQEITARIHRWWNSLPPALQDEDDEQNRVEPSRRTPYVSFFTMLHNYLILLVNRPFLSLPPDRVDFQASLQAAVTAGRNIILTLKRSMSDPFLMAWPGTLSATWMAGLVVAFSSLLGFYPFTKAQKDLEQCLEVLSNMASRWNSARQCHGALTRLLQRLNGHVGTNRDGTDASWIRASNRQPEPAPRWTDTSDAQVAGQNENGNDSVETRNAKRPRLHSEDGMRRTTTREQTPFPAWDAVSYPPQDWMPMPVVEYTGPDFGFDTTGFGAQGFFGQPPDVDFEGLFSNTGWDAYLQGFGDRGGA